LIICLWLLLKVTLALAKQLSYAFMSLIEQREAARKRETRNTKRKTRH